MEKPPASKTLGIKNETLCLIGNAGLGIAVGILGGLGMKMHDRLLAAYTPEQKQSQTQTITTAKQFYQCFLGLMIIGVILTVAFLLASKTVPAFTKSVNTTLLTSVGLSVLLAIFALILGALGVQVYKNLTAAYTPEQTAAISKSTKAIHTFFLALMIIGAVLLVIVCGLGSLKLQPFG